MLVDKESQKIIALDKLPQILLLNKFSEPLKWANYENYTKLLVKNKILWSMGSYEVVLRGGINAVTGKQSKLVIDTIVAVDTTKSPYNYKDNIPTLNKDAIFSRDRGICCYCATLCSKSMATCEHILPLSKGGANTWTNLVTACKTCNNLKGSMLLNDENCPVQLLYIPYVPSLAENFILRNRSILKDQMNFLMKKVPKNSRLYEKDYN